MKSKQNNISKGSNFFGFKWKGQVYCLSSGQAQIHMSSETLDLTRDSIALVSIFQSLWKGEASKEKEQRNIERQVVEISMTLVPEFFLCSSKDTIDRSRINVTASALGILRLWGELSFL